MFWRPNKQWPFFITLTKKSSNQLLAFLNLYQHAKVQFIPSVHSWDSVKFKDHVQTTESLSTCTNTGIPSVYSSDTVIFRVSSPDWPHSFLISWPCSPQNIFIASNNTNFYYGTNQVNINLNSIYFKSSLNS